VAAQLGRCGFAWGLGRRVIESGAHRSQWRRHKFSSLLTFTRAYVCRAVRSVAWCPVGGYRSRQ
jgi:hypothetical protein